jgi:tyrosyl-tRNA synthetase
MGRELLKEKNKDKFVLCVKLLADPTGKKMGKSEGNMITLNDSPKEMYGKVLSWTDGMILGGFELCTTVPMDEITQIAIGMQNGENPMEYKKRLAREIIQVYYSPEEALLAETEWQSTFSDKQFPEDAPVIAITKEQSILDWLVETEMISSKSEARRLITAGGIKIITDTDEIKITDPNQLVVETIRVKVGAKKFIVFKK